MVKESYPIRTSIDDRQASRNTRDFNKIPLVEEINFTELRWRKSLRQLNEFYEGRWRFTSHAGKARIDEVGDIFMYVFDEKVRLDNVGCTLNV